jgi:hypothetical protein
MTTNTEQRRAELMARSERAFTQHVVNGISLADLAPELGVSRETARSDVAAYKAFLADVNKDDLPAKRAARLAQLDDMRARARALFDQYKDTKPLTAVGALNSAIATLVHIRAIEGLDAPKEARVEQDTTITVVWGEDDDPVQHQYPND